MYIEIITTITSKVPVNNDGLGAPEHSVDIEAEDELPADAIYAVVYGGCQSASKGLLSVSDSLQRMVARREARGEN